VRVHGYFSKPKEVREKSCVGKTVLDSSETVLGATQRNISRWRQRFLNFNSCHVASYVIFGRKLRKYRFQSVLTLVQCLAMVPVFHIYWQNLLLRKVDDPP
jgi:hypothetical protein